jgi:hypothetical protein
MSRLPGGHAEHNPGSLDLIPGERSAVGDQLQVRDIERSDV